MVEYQKDGNLFRRTCSVELTSDTSNLVSLNEYLFLDGLHGIDLLSDDMLHHVYLAIGTSTNGLEYLEVTLLNSCLHC